MVVNGEFDGRIAVGSFEENRVRMSSNHVCIFWHFRPNSFPAQASKYTPFQSPSTN